VIAGAAATGGAAASPARRPALGTGAGPVSGLPSDPMRGAREAPGAGNGAEGVRQGFTPSGARIGRNDPCWCGSGQKYKKCHGA
jgi:preprotein translocase subunit SecA